MIGKVLHWLWSFFRGHRFIREPRRRRVPEWIDGMLMQHTSTIQFPSRRAGKWAFLLRALASSVADSKFQNARDCLQEQLHFSIQAFGKDRLAIRDDPGGPHLHVEPENAAVGEKRVDRARKLCR